MTPMSSLLYFLFLLLLTPPPVAGKSIIEPCSSSDACNALVGYSLYADLKVSEVAALFQVDPLSLLAANAGDLSAPGAADFILPAGTLLRVPVVCACSGGIRRSVSVHYLTRPADTIAAVAGEVYGGLVSGDQIREANGISGGGEVDAGWNLAVPLPCTCFNNSDDLLPAIYLSYVVRAGDTAAQIAAAHSTTVTDILNANAMGSPSVNPGDILAIPLPACASVFPRYAADYGLIAANGSFAITAATALYCAPAALAVSCASMQCANSDLMLGARRRGLPAAAALSTSLQPKCPGPRELPALSLPPATLARRPSLSPSPAPAAAGAVPAGGGFPGLSPAEGPAGSFAGNGAGAVTGGWRWFAGVVLLRLVLELLLP
ncbi:unnamed protein product [Spirodela intermedia]|uniref:LysM domain-containing protein n=1 Tax=Spirodela intermedia TaxID=51605 RepID=A0A7I8INH3_SPIIN|nr:unnamed protein product [Spirodela intermedia]CAA6659416.1 unnamed protein product [Spirodela intermedia]